MIESSPHEGEGSASTRCRLGVLFVHGIGEQREGETLLAFGEPLIAWMREWIEGHGTLALSESALDRHRSALDWLGRPPRDGVHVTSASLFPSKRHSADPPHSVVDIRISHRTGQSRRRHQRWLFAESWWGEQVQPPPVFDLLRWMFSRGPWIAFAHSAERAWLFTQGDTGNGKTRRGWLDSAWRSLAWPLAALRFLAASASLQLLLLIAWVFALIPIPTVRRYVSAALQKMTSILGDSYGLVANDSQRGAILTRFQETVNWVRSRCEKLVIVAHSQGTAVVHEAIQASLIAPPSLLVTFGSGLAKLHQLRECEVSWRLQLAVAGWILPTALAAVLLHAWYQWGSGGNDVIGLPILFGTFYFACFGCIVGAWSGWRITRVEPDAARGSADGDYRWVDLYASHDPVPQGPLTEHLPRRGIVSERIVNRRSTLTDHVTYWKNKSEFVTRVVAELDNEAQLLGIPDLRTDSDYQRAKSHHLRAIQLLGLAWWGIVALLLAAALRRFDDMASIGERFLDALEDSPFEALSSYLQAAGAAVRLATEAVTGSVPAIFPRLGHVTLAIVGLLLLLYLWWNIVAALLTRWESAQLSDFLGYERSKTWGPYGTWLVWPFVMLVGVLPVPFALVLATGGSLWSLTLQTLTVAAVLIGLIVALLFLVGLAQELPKAATATNLRRLLATLADAVEPGSDDPAAPRRGWESWRSLLGWFFGALMLAALAGMLIDKITSQSDSFRYLMLLPFAVLLVLMLVRSYRLVLQRGYASWVATLAVAVPLAFCGYLTLMQDASVFPLLWRLRNAAVVTATFMAPLTYAALAQWLPVRKALA